MSLKFPFPFTLFLLTLLNLSAQEQFWDDPEFLVRRGEIGRFPQTAVKGDLAVVMWQERQTLNGDWPKYNFSLSTKVGAGDWKIRRNIMSSVTIPGQEVSLFSLALGTQDLLVAAVLQENGSIILHRANGPEGNFSPSATLKNPGTVKGTLLAPRLYTNPDGSFLLFVTQAREDSFQILVSQGSSDAARWSTFIPVTNNPEQTINFSPSYVNHNNRGYMTYQSRINTAYQIFLRTTEDSGLTWSSPVLVSDRGQGQLGADQFNNQRPFLSSSAGALHVVWERNQVGTRAQVQYALLNEEGKIQETSGVTNITTGISSPQILSFQNAFYVTWLDNRSGSYNFFWAFRQGNLWQTRSLPSLSGDSLFVQGVPTSDGLYFFWENRFNNQSSLAILRPDRKVDPPDILPVNFQTDKRYNLSSYNVNFSLPRDPNGILGFNFLWTNDPEESVPQVSSYSIQDRAQSKVLETEGLWYLKAIAQDRAGNWSPEAVVSVLVDKTPPLPVKFIPPVRDDKGFFLSNSFEINWEPRSEDTLGYNYRLEYVGANLIPVNWERVNVPPPGPFFITQTPRASFVNRENGLWGLSVLAVDQAGNASEPSVYFFRLGKFIASTRVDEVAYQQDEFGRLAVRINGRGFDTEGLIAKVVVDRDGQIPWDLETTDFQVLSDRQIRLGVLDYLREGSYRLGVLHPTRGLVFSRPVMKVDEKGTVKFGDFSQWGEYPWQFEDVRKWVLSVDNVYYWLVLTVLALWFVLSSTGAVSAVREYRTLGTSMKLISATLGGKPMALEEKEKIVKAIKKRGLGLRFKFTASILGLTVGVILLLSLTMGFFIIGNSQRSLAEGLKQRTSVLANSLSSISAIGLKTRDKFILPSVPRQILSMSDANYATVTGWYYTTDAATTKPGYNYVWGSNDPGIAEKIGAPLQNPFGSRSLNDAVSQRLAVLEEEVNTLAKNTLGSVIDEISKLELEQQKYLGKTDAESVRINNDYTSRLDRLDIQKKEVEGDITTEKFESIPKFDPDNLSPGQKTYIFFKPVVFSTASDPNFYKGAVRIEVSVESILTQINTSRDQLILLVAIISAFAMGLGLVGALLLAYITVNPIKILVRGVERIRNTEDKSELKEFELEVNTGDELADLADSIKTMAYGLYKAAEAAKDLTVGKDTQKMFINLDKDARGRKITTASLETPELELFGYYEGAKGVSGDYFDYGDLNEEYLYFIKCDVSGKGVPAALIMVEVATIVLNHFRFWDPKKDGVRLSPTVDRINTLLEERGFKGRFAALTLGLLNKKTRKVHLCHAGDRDIQLFDSAKGKMETRKLSDSPATGVFPKDLMDMKGMQYRDVVYTLNPGDILFLYTDGIDEAKRNFRNKNFEPIAFMDTKDISTLVPPGTKMKINGQDKDAIDGQDLGGETVHNIIESILHHRKFTLVKDFNPIPDENLVFDFSHMKGTVKECIIGLAAVEKLFRIYPDPKATSEDIIRVDVMIDDMLKNSFSSYNQYFKTTPLVKKHEEEYRFFPKMKEDDQYDDLTLLAIRVK